MWQRARVIAAAILTMLAGDARADGMLSDFPYPYPVQHHAFASQGQALVMAYMDVPPAAEANGRTVILFHGKNFCGATWEQIPLEQIERIEVLRGPAAAVYGSDAIAGVVQLFTRRGTGPARPSAALTLGSYGTVQAQAGVSGSAATSAKSISE